MKKFIVTSLFILSVLACKKKELSPEGPTDIRIRNKSDLTFQNVIVSTSEKTGDTVTIGTIPNGSTSDYFRITKAYPKAEISAMINVNGSQVKFSTGSVSYTYMQYIGRDRITYEVYISNMTNKELSISDVIEDEALVLK
jgi:hypothetical protein